MTIPAGTELHVAIVGGGPAGLMAAEVLSARGARVDLYERMPTVGRKLLMAGRGGLNLTHSEPLEIFLTRYGAAAGRMATILDAFPPQALSTWAEGLGEPVFTGSSGRVFPKSMKASPLLRAWLARLAAQGVRIHTRRRWTGWTPDGALDFDGETVRADAVVLALGGASWGRLGSDGQWADALAVAGVGLAPFAPANSGFTVAWSEVFKTRFAGAPLKNIALSFAGHTARGEAMVAAYGLEGGAVYALSAHLREAIAARGSAAVTVDLRPQMTVARLRDRLHLPRGAQSASTFLRKALKLSPVEVNLLREAGPLPDQPGELAMLIKAAPLTLTGVQPLDRAISTAGGVRLDQLDNHLMLAARPGVFVAGEMLDWEAPTGGYLLQAAMATGVVAANGVLARAGKLN